ncbi:preprotein translocase subunit SecA [Catenulispora sp. MAP12-49]|uniref:preprotein translocase subunit SecA n=1 Tax=Catenulispora sp. MAP12-49 TaxID=3156302 RepID=UPI003511C998
MVDLAEEETRGLSDTALRRAINTLRQRHQNGESLDALLPETFAIVREASVRMLGERPYTEQLIGGAALHLGAAVEMKTGEGKTLTGVLPACLHALTGQGVHVMTANDYLAARDAEWMGPVYGLSLALQAKELYVKDRDYAVVDGAIRVIDTTTQRPLSDRTLHDGLDQALDAKEGLEVRPERQQLATIDVHAYLKLYSRLAGMTGVIEGEADAYPGLYGLECVIVPPHHPVRRVDHDPSMFANDGTMLRAVGTTVQTQCTAGRPVLVGTASDEMAGRISQTLRAAGVEHDVLDARSHEREAEIIARAGRPGAVTVLTRMAGRGVDIRLAEPEGAGLYVLGVGPMSSRRMELHLRGRAGRGGDPGESAFYFSLEDALMKNTKTAQRLTEGGMDGPLGPNFAITRLILAKLNAVSAFQTQSLTEKLRFSAVREEQRAGVYARREEVLRDGITQDRMDGIIHSVIQTLVLAARTGPQDVDRLAQALGTLCPATVSRDTIAVGLSGSPTSKVRADLVEAVVRDVRAADTARVAELGPNTAARLRRRVMLSVLDRLWRGQLRDLDDAQDGQTLRTVAGGDALGGYQRTASRLAATMWEEIDEQFVGYWFNVEV